MTDAKAQLKENILSFLEAHRASGDKDWFGFAQQKVTGINLCHEIAANHADKLSPEEVVDYVIGLNNAIYQKFIRVR
jgi:hypothetical protein